MYCGVRRRGHVCVSRSPSRGHHHATFGALWGASGYNLWAVILCHGLDATIAFVRFAHKQSAYSKQEKDDG